MFTCMELLSNPNKIDEIKERYAILRNQVMRVPKRNKDTGDFWVDAMGSDSNALDKAINLMASRGWRCISITATILEAGNETYALMERV